MLIDATRPWTHQQDRNTYISVHVAYRLLVTVFAAVRDVMLSLTFSAVMNFTVVRGHFFSSCARKQLLPFWLPLPAPCPILYPFSPPPTPTSFRPASIPSPRPISLRASCAVGDSVYLASVVVFAPVPVSVLNQPNKNLLQYLFQCRVSQELKE